MWLLLLSRRLRRQRRAAWEMRRETEDVRWDQRNGGAPYNPWVGYR